MSKGDAILLVTACLAEPHGSAKSARDLSRALLASHNNVHIASRFTEDFGESAAGRALAKPTWYRYPRSLPRPGGWRGRLSDARDELTRFAIRRAAKDQFVIVNGWASYRYWKELDISGYLRSAIVIRESPRHFEGDDLALSLTDLRSGFAEFDRLIFVSERQRKDWGHFAEISRKPAFHLPNCCEEEDVARVLEMDRQELRRKWGMKQEELVLICPGTIEKRKGQDTVLGAWHKVLEFAPQASLVVLGDGGTEWGRALAAEIDGGRYGARVRRIPAQPSALELLHAADVLVFPSRAEALPRTILEAMALGLPSVATDVDGVPELIEDKKSGLLFNPADTVAMLEQLRFVCTNPELACELGLAARQRYGELFSRSRQIERTAALLTWLAAA